MYFSAFPWIYLESLFPMVSRQERYVLICTCIWQSSLMWFPWLLPLYFTWIQNSKVAAYMNCIFKRRFVRIKLYLMSKHLRFLLYCFKCNKLYFYKNEQLYLLATKRLIFSFTMIKCDLINYYNWSLLLF